MNIQLVHNDKTIEIDYPHDHPGFIKLYSVPESYSADGLYAAVWKRGDLEPHPASAGKDSLLIVALSVEEDNGCLFIIEEKNQEGVFYAG